MNVSIVVPVNQNVQILQFTKEQMIGDIKMVQELKEKWFFLLDADAAQTPISDDIYYIVPGKCTECKGFHKEPQCAAVCPVDCCIPDENHVESEETLLARQAFLHN
jgi:ferredoxin